MKIKIFTLLLLIFFNSVLLHASTQPLHIAFPDNSRNIQIDQTTLMSYYILPSAMMVAIRLLIYKMIRSGELRIGRHAAIPSSRPQNVITPVSEPPSAEQPQSASSVTTECGVALLGNVAAWTAFGLLYGCNSTKILTSMAWGTIPTIATVIGEKVSGLVVPTPYNAITGVALGVGAGASAAPLLFDSHPDAPAFALGMFTAGISILGLQCAKIAHWAYAYARS